MSAFAMRPAALAAAAAILAVAGGVGMARPLARGAESWTVAPEGVQPGMFAADGRACVKQCPNDQLPCDPPAYKQADGRCTTQWH